MLRGTTKDIDTLPSAQANMDDTEAFLPFHIELRNGHLTEAKNWAKRPGYVSKWDTGVDKRVRHLIPGTTVDNSYAVVDDSAYSLGSTIASIGSGFTGTNRPMSVNFRTTSGATNTIIIVDGGTPQKIASNALADLGGSPVSAKFAVVMDSRLILSGHNDLTFVWSNVDDAETIAAASNNSVLGGSDRLSERIEMMQEHLRQLYFWKTRSMEIWQNVGGTSIFARRVVRGMGTEAGYSVVKADNTFFWLGHDYEFYRLDRDNPVIIGSGVTGFSDDIRALTDPTEVYGFHFTKEKMIRWFAPSDNKCFVYDYVNNVFSQDNGWNDGEVFLPINAYMEVGVNAYIGDYNKTGLVYTWSRDSKDDAGQEIRVRRDFRIPISASDRGGRVNKLRFRVKRGVATATETAPEMMVRWRFDEGAWRATQQFGLGATGDYYPFLDLNRLGIGKEIEIDVTETDAVDFLVTSMHMTVEQMR